MMNQKVKTKWLKALRSGKYEQGYHGLFTNDEKGKSYCCLGVLCDLHKKSTHASKWEKDTANPRRMVYAKEAHYLPTIVREWAGVGPNPHIIYKTVNSLAQMNDHRESFEEIAKIIEEQL